MKKIGFLALVIVLLSSGACKKNKDQKPRAPTALLSLISSNGVPNRRFFYSPDNQPIRIEFYGEQPANALEYYFKIDYTGNNISQLTTVFMPGEVQGSRIAFTHDGQGRIIKYENYDLQGLTPNTPALVATYTYNAEGRWNTITVKDNSGQFLYRLNASYFPNGDFKEVQRYNEKNNLLYLFTRDTYSLPSGKKPQALDQLETVLGPDLTGSLYYQQMQSLRYNQSNVINYNRQQQMSGREYNPDSTLRKQVVTFKFNLPADADLINTRDYEYILK